MTKKTKGRASVGTSAAADKKVRKPSSATNGSTKAVSSQPITTADLGKAVTKTRWLWRDWIPKGHVTLLVGEPGAGKTQTALTFTRSIITQKSWPDKSKRNGKPGVAVWCDTESSQAILFGHIKRWKLPAKRIVLPGDDPLMSVDLSDRGSRKMLEDVVKKQKPALVVIDSLGAGHTGDENSSRDVTDVIGFLAKLARNCRCAVVVIHHLRKRGLNESNGINLDRIRGSSSLAYLTRSVLCLTHCIIQDGDELRLEVLKSNLAPKPEPLAVTIEARGLTFKPASPLAGVRMKTKSEQVKDFLHKQLANGPKAIKNVEAEANKTGIAHATLFRVKKTMGITTTGGKWYLNRGGG